MSDGFAGNTRLIAASTQVMAARTQVMTSAHKHREHTPSRRALATRSWTAAQRLSGSERTEAIKKHFEDFPPANGSTCRR